MDWAHPIFVVFAFLFGAVIGSYLNVFIYRVPMGMSTVKPGSHCFQCKAPIRWYHNIPILSYFILRGKCPDCGAEFSIRYALVELLTAVLFALVWWAWSHGDQSYAPGVALMYLLLVSGLVAGSFIDLDHYILPDRITIGGLAIAPLASLAVPALHYEVDWLAAVAKSLLGIGVGYWLLKSIAGIGEMIMRREAMGEGDVKLMAALGGFFGWQGAVHSLMTASIIGAMIGILFLVFKPRAGKGRQSSIAAGPTPAVVPGPMISSQVLSVTHGRHRMKLPFGPFIAIGALTWMLGGGKIWDLYFNWMAGGGL